MEITSGTTAEDILDSGKRITCTVRALTCGLMAENMKESTIMIKSMATEFTNGPTEESTKASGKTESSMDRESLLFKIKLLK